MRKGEGGIDVEKMPEFHTIVEHSRRRLEYRGELSIADYHSNSAVAVSRRNSQKATATVSRNGSAVGQSSTTVKVGQVIFILKVVNFFPINFFQCV